MIRRDVIGRAQARLDEEFGGQVIISGSSDDSVEYSVDVDGETYAYHVGEDRIRLSVARYGLPLWAEIARAGRLCRIGAIKRRQAERELRALAR